MTEDRKNLGGTQENEGEGNKTAARRYNEAVERTANSGRVQEKAREAAAAREGEERAELDAAEAAGKQRSHGEDPKVTRRPQSPGTTSTRIEIAAAGLLRREQSAGMNCIHHA